MVWSSLPLSLSIHKFSLSFISVYDCIERFIKKSIKKIDEKYMKNIYYSICHSPIPIWISIKWKYLSAFWAFNFVSVLFPSLNYLQTFWSVWQFCSFVVVHGSLDFMYFIRSERENVYFPIKMPSLNPYISHAICLNICRHCTWKYYYYIIFGWNNPQKLMQVMSV